MNKNRISQLQSDYIFTVVRKPRGWLPADIASVPPTGEVLTRDYVASYEEAVDDLKRCNNYSMEQGLNTWAVIESPEAGL